MKKKLLCILLTAILIFSSLMGCGGNSSSSHVKFWVYGTAEEVDMFTRLVEGFNNSYGKENGITVDISTKDSAGYKTSITATANSEKNGPDVYFVADADYKTQLLGHYFCNMQEYIDQVTDIDLGIESGEMLETTYTRLRYNVETNTSNDSDPLYGLPLDTQPTALYYNKTLFEKAGIKVISVDEKDLPAWNNNEIPDKTGKYKRDFGIADEVVIPAKGYYRSKNPYYYNGEMTANWVAPTNSTLLVFNNRIAMNWDETEDLAMLFSAETNPSVTDKSLSVYGTKYGYFTEWWYNYGWSVGGDCLLDLTGKGDWNFSLLDPNANYVVMKDTYTGISTGKVYNVGEIIEFADKMDIAPNETVVADDFGDYHHGSKTGEKVGIRQDILLNAGEGKPLQQMPSTREAFCRYLKLGAATDALIDGEGGLNVSPNPNQFVSALGAMTYFWSGSVAFEANISAYMVTLSEQAKKRNFEWDVAPLAVYKEYKNPEDPNCVDIVAQGKISGHSNTKTAVIRTKSQKKLEATKFVMWMCSAEGQKIRADLGFFPNQKSLINKIQFQEGKSAANAEIFSELLEFESKGDWMYMPDHLWVEEWCTDLNADVRNGKMTFDAWYSPAIIRTNSYLLRYKQYSR